MRKFIKTMVSFFCTTISLAKIKHGERCRCNFLCKFTSKTRMGNNCNFNGMKVSGAGNVNIGNNFHSGRQCRIITSFHNYDKGNAIPYDETMISKDVIIEDNVWLGEHVFVIGG